MSNTTPLTQWKAEFLLDLQHKKIWVCLAAAKFISNPKVAGSKKAYVEGVKSFLRGHGLKEELEKFMKATKPVASNKPQEALEPEITKPAKPKKSAKAKSKA